MFDKLADDLVRRVVDKTTSAVVERIYALGNVVVRRSAVLRVHRAVTHLRDDGWSQDAMDELDIAMTHLTVPLSRQRATPATAKDR